jgi:Methyltransferase domain
MHEAAWRFLKAVSGTLRRPETVCEIGSRNVNGTARVLFHDAEYIGVDLMPGPVVDVVADGATWQPGREFDVVICTETMEHAPDQEALARNLVTLCRSGGVIIVTAAGMDREPHSAIDGGPLREGEPYKNLMPEELQEWFDDCRAVLIDERTDGDIYCVAVK